MKRLFAFVTLALTLNFAAPAKAETLPADLPANMDAVFALLEAFILNGNGIPSVVTIGGCKPSFKLALPAVEFSFTSSSTCPLNGKVVFSLIPLSASVRLEISNSPYVTGVDGDFTMSLKKGTEWGSTVFQWRMTNGRIAFRTSPSAPLTEWMMTGEGLRKNSKTSLAVNTRVNTFDRATGNGRAMVKTITQAKPSAAVKTAQACALTGASADNVQSGTLSNCAPLK